MRKKSLIFLLLFFASLLSFSMLAVRVVYSTQFSYLFLAWNLFLAWLPLIFVVAADRLRSRRWLRRCFVFLWLLFFPNSFYMVTDLLHLRPLADVPLWYDLIMLFSFALTGLFLGFLSLNLVQTMVVRRWGSAAGWLFVVISLGLSGLGVYIGRFLRWNSWDIFIAPARLLQDVAGSLLHPKTVVATALLSLIFIFSYGVLSSFPHLSGTIQPAATQPQE